MCVNDESTRPGAAGHRGLAPALFRRPAAEGTVAAGCQCPAPAEGMGSEGVTQPLEGSHKAGREESSVQAKHPGGKAVWW